MDPEQLHRPLYVPDLLVNALSQDPQRPLLQLIDEVAWKQESMGTPAGRVALPRLTAWQGEADAIYVYSGIRNVPQAWTPRHLARHREPGPRRN